MLIRNLVAVGFSLLWVLGCGEETTGGGGGAAGSGAVSGSGGTAGTAGGGGSGATDGGSSGTGAVGGGGSAGSGGSAGAWGGAQRVHYTGDFDVAGKSEVGLLTFPGPVQLTLAFDGLEDSSTVFGTSFSPDGQRLALVARGAGTAPTSLRVYPHTGAPTTLVSASSSARHIHAFGFSPDGEWIAFIADLDALGADGLYVVPSSGAAPPKRVSPTTSNPDLDVQTFAWARHVTSSSARLAFVGDLVTDTLRSVWTVDAAADPPNPVEVVPESALVEGDVVATLDWDHEGRLYFRGNFASAAYRLYRADAEGKSYEPVPQAQLSNEYGEASIGNLGISPSGKQLAFSADAPTAGVYQVSVLDLTGSAAPIAVTAVPAVAPTVGYSGPSFTQAIRWSPDGKKLAFGADWRVDAGDVDNAFCAYVVHLGSAPEVVRLLGVPSSSVLDVYEVRFSNDGQRLFVRGDLATDAATELFSTDDLGTPDQDVPGRRVEEVPPGGGVESMDVAPLN